MFIKFIAISFFIFIKFSCLEASRDDLKEDQFLLSKIVCKIPCKTHELYGHYIQDQSNKLWEIIDFEYKTDFIHMYPVNNYFINMSFESTLVMNPLFKEPDVRCIHFNFLESESFVFDKGVFYQNGLRYEGHIKLKFAPSTIKDKPRYFPESYGTINNQEEDYLSYKKDEENDSIYNYHCSNDEILIRSNW